MLERLSGQTRLTALLAAPARHSLSPKMHNAAYAKLGLDYAYLAFEVDNSGLAAAVQGMRALGICGANVSMPNKQAIVPLLDELSPAAALAGAVNTVVNKDGRGHLVGHITDGTGAIRALAEEGVSIKDQIITIAGAGGAGTAIAVQLGLDGAKEIRLFNRKTATFKQAKQVLKGINAKTSALASLQDLADDRAFRRSIAESSIYVDATGVGMKPLEEHRLITDPALIRPDLVVFDLVYHPAETKLLAFAREHGAKKVMNGLGMLLYQGAEAFKLMTGEDMPVAYIRELLCQNKE
ncbi:shikimate dehydrogenase [Streptococcus equi subsp. zooepidemicus]|uniref:shikimate dehydrogenase n=1 Tax=Streptococcus equi TaxID=1336 RepID=UPI0010CACD37|nr:shikimate dehydrogenase [Streptococcus equi]MCD3411218.1 shikimate dehydrogenase [Streptococcus equi subsp. zooepidemicus]MCD3453440.1 shikimate dehydrogenase [Streptococcus equi subsp. zooepidemicus]MDI6075258.1 shikimate dehydrogenase [Streptococcus equi subsp. zooepidemicus]QUQ80533.1 Shikimate dehydrogenase (NADP(+)) [Streptococcus equi subsp. zooepidemicus]VTS33655.1 shikimate 5-dehydrogenase [Streptococcus equi subsp. zooepidemicus]